MKTAEDYLFQHVHEVINLGSVVDAMEEYKNQSIKEAIKVALQVASERANTKNVKVLYNHVLHPEGVRINKTIVDKQSILSCEEEVLKQLNIK